MLSPAARPLRTVAYLTLGVLGLATALVSCELAARIIDGQPVMAARLPGTPFTPRPARQIDPTLGAGSLPADIEPAWITMSPPPHYRPPIDKQLVAQGYEAVRRGGQTFEVFRIWNRLFVQQNGCQPGSVFQRLPQPLLVFDPPEPMPFPTYRYLPSHTMPGGMATNAFGWRGPEIPLDKPPDTIRLAFVGASTTVGAFLHPYSYPEYVVHWLNLWAERNAVRARFDGINAGREGLSSGHIAVVTRQEVLPAEPDLVVYYEGANQSLCVLGDQRTPRPRSAAWALVDRVLAPASLYSQLARRAQAAALMLKAHGGYEPEKPPSAPDWPGGLDEQHPDIDDPGLPARMQAILADLDAMRGALAAEGSELALSSFVWLVRDGLQLDPQKHPLIYSHLNDECWPYHYADTRRSVDLHNRVLEHYAAAHGLPFIPVAESFPLDPSLFNDAVHFTTDGTRLHAWIVFRTLLPLVRARIDAGGWPRPDRIPVAAHPSIGPWQSYTLSCGDE